MSDEASTAQAVGSNTPLRFLPIAIRTPERPLRAIAVGWLTAFTPSILLGAIGTLVAPHASLPHFPGAGPVILFLLVVFSPVLETLIMGGALLILLRFLPVAAAVAVSAIGWGIAHSLKAPLWGLVIWWPFLVFSTLFVTWRSRSLALAFALPMCVHALQNLIPALLVAYGRPI